MWLVFHVCWMPVCVLILISFVEPSCFWSVFWCIGVRWHSEYATGMNAVCLKWQVLQRQKEGPGEGNPSSPSSFTSLPWKFNRYKQLPAIAPLQTTECAIDHASVHYKEHVMGDSITSPPPPPAPQESVAKLWSLTFCVREHPSEEKRRVVLFSLDKITPALLALVIEGNSLELNSSVRSEWQVH